MTVKLHLLTSSSSKSKEIIQEICEESRNLQYSQATQWCSQKILMNVMGHACHTDHLHINVCKAHCKIIYMEACMALISFRNLRRKRVWLHKTSMGYAPQILKFRFLSLSLVVNLTENIKCRPRTALLLLLAMQQLNSRLYN